MYHGGEVKKKSNPRENANLASRITFTFTYDLFKKGYKKDIEEDDIYNVVSNFRSSKLGDQLEKQWSIEQKRRDPSVFRLLWACYGKYYLFLGVLQLLMKIILVIVQPRVMAKLVSYFTATSKLTRYDAACYAAILIAINVGYCTYAHNYMFWIMELGIRVRTAFCSLIYRKALKLTASSLSNTSVGKIVTLISKDVNSFDNAIIFLNDMWISLILLIITTYLMYIEVGIATFAGVLFLILIIPLQLSLGKLTSYLRIKAGGLTDRRLQVTQETLSAIKIIKMYTWETVFGGKISQAREEEMKKIKQIYFTKATSLVIGSLVINITLYIIVMTYTSLGNNFTAAVAFYLQSCLHSLRSSVTISIPLGIAQSAELIASARRIKQVLTAEEQAEVTRHNEIHKPLIQMNDVSVKIKDTTIIHNINLKINKGLNIVTGRLGGGKSSLLKTILEDYPIFEGKLNVQGTVSYASEEPWLFPSSIKQNILFGQNFNGERYNKVVQVCALEMDIDSFDKGDNTIVDDRGMNLSRGQQARISLARAVYNDCDIYLLDDCLSSLDTHVQEFVFRECVKNFLKDKIVVMISNNERQIREADNIIAMENCTIKSIVKPSEIENEELGDIIGEDITGEVDADIVDNIQIERDEEAGEETKLLGDKPRKNIYFEEKKEGQVNWDVYKRYFRFGGGIVISILIFIVFVISQIGTSLSDKMLSKWITIQQNITEMKINMTNGTQYNDLIKTSQKNLNIYSATIAISTVLILFRAYAHFSFAGKASVGLHKAMIHSVVNAIMPFFDIRHLGNILNRFSKDLGTIDELLPLTFYECFRGICVLAGVMVLIATVNTFFLLPAAGVLAIACFLRMLYLPTGRSLKRLDSATRSPVIGHLNASLEGLPTIRASGIQDKLKMEFDKHQDLYTSAFHMMQCTSRAFAYLLDILCNCFVAVVIITLLVIGKATQVGNVGLAITQALMLTGVLQWIIRQWAELENQMTSVERTLEYTDIDTEFKDGSVIDKWPTSGAIDFKNVNLTYGNSKEYVLKNINFTINSQEKIGIVGRTGAGKSSLISTIFRLYENEGTVKIDDVDVKTVSLEFLRSSIAIIPQDPILFTGTIRSNIDPTNRYSDEEIWKAIDITQLKKLVASLDDEITDGGSNFSSGQRQLICLARAVISRNKIIILDEATANMDPETDVLIYSTIQKNFASCTVITVAHRLHTVLYSDKVMVVDRGEIVEFDDPHVLLSNKDGIFYKMVKQACLLK